MNINLDYKISTGDIKAIGKIERISNREMTLEYLTQAVMSKYRDGIEGSLRRMWGRIQRKIDDAIDKNIDTVELDTAEKDFIKESFKDAKFTPIVAKYVQVLEDEIDSWDKK